MLFLHLCWSFNSSLMTFNYRRLQIQITLLCCDRSFVNLTVKSYEISCGSAMKELETKMRKRFENEKKIFN